MSAGGHWRQGGASHMREDSVKGGDPCSSREWASLVGGTGGLESSRRPLIASPLSSLTTTDARPHGQAAR